jgi:hypothetical protein
VWCVCDGRCARMPQLSSTVVAHVCFDLVQAATQAVPVTVQCAFLLLADELCFPGARACFPAHHCS